MIEKQNKLVHYSQINGSQYSFLIGKDMSYTVDLLQILKRYNETTPLNN